MLYYDKLNVSEGIDVNKTSAPFLSLLVFLDKRFKLSAMGLMM